MAYAAVAVSPYFVDGNLGIDSVDRDPQLYAHAAGALTALGMFALFGPKRAVTRSGPGIREASTGWDPRSVIQAFTATTGGYLAGYSAIDSA